MKIRRVDGPSMEPTLLSGDIVLSKRVNTGDLIPGDIIIIKHYGKELIKRLSSIDSSGIYISGDNKEQSTDSRHFGLLPIESEVWRVVMVWPKSARWPRAVVRSV